MPLPTRQGQISSRHADGSYIWLVQPAPPVYFPVKPEPLRMQAGLQRFGNDFGNGEADRSFFPRDRTSARYVAEKARVLADYPERDARDVRDAGDEAAVAAGYAWLTSTLRREGYPEPSMPGFSGIGRELSEDFAILRREPSGGDRVLWLHACFPGGWRPEHVLGKSFAQIHAIVPAFEATHERASSLTCESSGK
jgi:hypothetical protein